MASKLSMMVARQASLYDPRYPHTSRSLSSMSSLAISRSFRLTFRVSALQTSHSVFSGFEAW